MNITGGEYIARQLKGEGVEKVFGIIDGTYMGLLVGLRKMGIELITPRHETSAAHMAGAYARISGKLGVCIASNGPGVANILPGVVVENAEANKVLLITSSRRTGIGYPDRGGTYQYFNQVGATKPITKWSGVASLANRIPELTKRALRKSYQGRPGVVHLDIPENLMNTKASYPDAASTSSYRINHRMPAPEELVTEALDLITKAKKPIIHVGSGIIHSDATQELAEAAKLMHTPVVTSWAARGAYSESSELSVPMVHVEVNNKVRQEADLVLIIGSRIGETDWWGKAPNWNLPENQKIIQVDIDEELIGMNRQVDLGIMADAKIFLEQLIKQIKNAKSSSIKRNNVWLNKIKMNVKKSREKLDKHLKNKKSPMNPAHLSSIANTVFDETAIVVFDGGNTAVWGNFYHKSITTNSILSTFKFGMLGAGVSQALGAKIAFPQRQVYCIIGDGAMGFHMQEIETAVRNNLNVIYIVAVDRQWGMVKMTQQFALKPLKTMVKKSLSSEEVINADLGEIHWDQLAESMGAHGVRVSSPKEYKEALQNCLSLDKCCLIHVDVDPVQHMWAPGLMHFKTMHQEPKGK